jgi:hypothetical protein
VSSDNERRRHRRYPLRLAIKLHRGDQVLHADIINSSSKGCLLLCPSPLEPGLLLEASIPELMIPRTQIHILRCQSTGSGYMMAASFVAALYEDSPLVWRAEEPPAPRPRWLN